MNWYHRKMPRLQYNPEVFSDIIEYAQQGPWERGLDKNTMEWNVRELVLDFEEFPILDELLQGLNTEFKRKHAYLSWVQPGGLLNHIDHSKWGNFALPLLGDFSSTPQYYFDQFNHPVEKFTIDCPVIFNTRMTHAVPVSNDDLSPRWALMIGIHDWVDNLFNKIDQHEIWTDTKNFKYEYI